MTPRPYRRALALALIAIIGLTGLMVLEGPLQWLSLALVLAPGVFAGTGYIVSSRT